MARVQAESHGPALDNEREERRRKKATIKTQIMGANLKISGVNSKKWNDVERFAFVKTKCLVITSEMDP